MTTVVLDGLSYVRVGRAVGISNIEVRQSMHLLGALGYYRPTAPSSPPLPSLAITWRRWPVGEQAPNRLDTWPPWLLRNT